MSLTKLKVITAILFAVIVLGVAVLVYYDTPEEIPVPQVVEEPVQEPVVPEPFSKHSIIGASVFGRDIEAYTFGNGENHLLFVGGIHGGYEWNSVYLAYRLIDYLEANPSFVPENLTVSVIPSANPDGLFEITQKEGRFTVDDVPDAENSTGAGRFNMNKVDLNRNFDCKWQPESTWRGTPVSAGTEAFSEPEARAIRDYVTLFSPNGAVFFHSQSNAVYASECLHGVLPETRDIMNAYATASGYKAVDTFDAYPITGDAEGWLASINIPAITVELSTHDTIEWDRNLAGITALFDHFKLKKVNNLDASNETPLSESN